ncbi:MAG: hypothetical protein IKR56_07345 [Lachnospiraceae bacterium]|nr:hypothetical protein [Lachnospiraceae bacterium]
MSNKNDLNQIQLDALEARRDEEKKQALRRRMMIRAYIRAGIFFFGGIIIGVSLCYVFNIFRQEKVSVSDFATLLGQVSSGEREMSEEEIQDLSEDTGISYEELDKLFSSYDDDAERLLMEESDRSEGSGDEPLKAEDLDHVTVIDWDSVRESNAQTETENDTDTAQDEPEEIGWDEAMADIVPAGNEENDEDSATAQDGFEEDMSAGDRIEAMKEPLSDGVGTTAALRKLFVDDIMVISGKKYYFFPIRDDLSKHDLSDEFLIKNPDGSLDYDMGDGRMAVKGIDVSRYQGVIDWSKVAGSGVKYAFLRAGFRGYGSGEIQIDETFLENAAQASANGIEIGVYFFTQAVNEEEAIEEAEFVLNLLGGNEIALPIAYDLERVNGGRMNSIDADQMTKNTRAFCDTVGAAGYDAMVYGNMESMLLMLNMDEVEDIPKWFAYYSDDIYFPYKFDVWQYSGKGRVDGITGDVDMNLYFR